MRKIVRVGYGDESAHGAPDERLPEAGLFAHGLDVASCVDNAELVVSRTDEELETYLERLKAQPGGDIHLSGGASFAHRVVGLALVDEFHLFVYPVVSPGTSWFSGLPGKYELESLSSNAYGNGVVKLHYAPATADSKARPSSFTELLT